MTQTALKLDAYASDDNEAESTYILSTLIGALTLSRAIDDRKLSDKILIDTAAALIEWHGGLTEG